MFTVILSLLCEVYFHPDSEIERTFDLRRKKQRLKDQRCKALDTRVDGM